jgi:hypothetical protein
VFTDELPKVLTPTIFSEFFLFGLISACIVQTVSFFSDVYCSHDSRIQKELEISKIGGIAYFVTGFLKFPFASPSTATTCGATIYEIIEQKIPNAFTAAVKTLMLSLLMFPYALLSISTIYGFVIVGSGGLLTILTMLCLSLLPISPFTKKGILGLQRKTILGIRESTCYIITSLLLWLSNVLELHPNLSHCDRTFTNHDKKAKIRKNKNKPSARRFMA